MKQIEDYENVLLFPYTDAACKHWLEPLDTGEWERTDINDETLVGIALALYRLKADPPLDRPLWQKDSRRLFQRK